MSENKSKNQHRFPKMRKVYVWGKGQLTIPVEIK